MKILPFQSPRSGKFVSNQDFVEETLEIIGGFNPLDLGNLYLIWDQVRNVNTVSYYGFNPLDRGNLYLILK